MKPIFKHALIAGTPLVFAGTINAATSEFYGYDASGNLSELKTGERVVRSEYGQSNQMISATDESGAEKFFEYDEAGRLVRVQNSDGKELSAYEYGYADQIIGVNGAEGSTEIFFNAEGHMVGKRASGSTQTDVMAWDGIALLVDSKGCSVNEAHPSGGVPVLMGNSTPIVSDYNGTSLSLGDQAIESTAYGAGAEEGRFTGKPYIEELGGYLFPKRAYLSEYGIWSSQDPLGFPDGENCFAYVKGDPINNIDPMGTATHTLTGNIDAPIPKPGGTALEHLGDSNLPYKFDISYDSQTPPTMVDGTVSWDTSSGVSAMVYHENEGAGGTNEEHRATEAKPTIKDFTAGYHTEAPGGEKCFYDENSFRGTSNVKHRRDTGGATQYDITLFDVDTDDSAQFDHPEH